MNRYLFLGCAALLLSALWVSFSEAQGKRDKIDRPPGVKVGKEAPDFDLFGMDGKSKIRLADYKGKSPVVLVFGSYT